ncbi:hypothetical protein ACPV3P_05380 [Photobacterium damselae]|uniref:hypothetical protein n=1 Tax=Photobacterium damselae TaxID=38293 RepID=UPI00406833F9
MSWRGGDSSETQAIIKKIQTFNRSKWGRMMPIKGVDLQRSIHRRQMNLIESKNGMKLNKKLTRLTKDSEYFSS